MNQLNLHHGVIKVKCDKGKPAGQLTSRKGLSQHLGGEGCLGAAALPLLRQVFAQHVPPPAVQETVQDVRGDHVRQRAARTLKSRLESQGVGGQHGAHVDLEQQKENQTSRGRRELWNDATASRAKEKGEAVDTESCSAVRPSPPSRA